MKKSMKIVAATALFSVAAFAADWTGTLVDASCMDQKKTSAQCAPTSSTSAYSLVLTDGTALKLDAKGNTKASDALKNSAERAKNPNEQHSVTAKVAGTQSGDTINVDTIEVE